MIINAPVNCTCISVISVLSCFYREFSFQIGMESTVNREEVVIVVVHHSLGVKTDFNSSCLSKSVYKSRLEVCELVFMRL